MRELATRKSRTCLVTLGSLTMFGRPFLIEPTRLAQALAHTLCENLSFNVLSAMRFFLNTSRPAAAKKLLASVDATVDPCANSETFWITLAEPPRSASGTCTCKLSFSSAVRRFQIAVATVSELPAASRHASKASFKAFLGLSNFRFAVALDAFFFGGMARGIAVEQSIWENRNACNTWSICHLFTRGVGLGWYMAAPGLERVWNGMERGLERNRPLQYSTATTQVVSTSLPDWEFGASASLGPSRHHTTQLCHSGQQLKVGGAGADLHAQVEKEGGSQAIHYAKNYLAAAKRIPSITQHSCATAGSLERDGRSQPIHS